MPFDFVSLSFPLTSSAGLWPCTTDTAARCPVSEDRAAACRAVLSTAPHAPTGREGVHLPRGAAGGGALALRPSFWAAQHGQGSEYQGKVHRVGLTENKGPTLLCVSASCVLLVGAALVHSRIAVGYMY